MIETIRIIIIIITTMKIKKKQKKINNKNSNSKNKNKNSKNKNKIKTEITRCNNGAIKRAQIKDNYTLEQISANRHWQIESIKG